MRLLRSTGLLIAGVFLIHIGCTENPFGGDEISGGYREMEGVVRLRDGGSGNGVYVWLEGISLGTYTDGSGSFTLSLPSGGSQGGGGGLSGIYNLYFYMANYHMDSAQVVLRDGEFVYSRASLNDDGRLTPSVELRRFLRIETSVDPWDMQESYTGDIQVNVTLTATEDSCTVVVPGSIGGGLGAVFVKQRDSEDVAIYTASPLNTREVILLGRMARTIDMRFNTITSPLALGDYDVIPYILVCHEPIPAGLKESLGSGVETLGPNYLKIPFRREGGYLHVK
jgi:hypothetical protein